MGMENLTPVALRDELREQGVSREQLAESWGVPLNQLDPEVRRRLLFRSDEECYKAALAASDGLEHGFKPLPDLHELAKSSRDCAAAHLREAILFYLSPAQDVSDRILGPEYREPKESFSFSRYARATLSGSAEGLAAPEESYPLFRASQELAGFSRNPDGSFRVSPRDELTAAFGDGVEVTGGVRYELWGPKGATRASNGEPKGNP